MLLSDAKNDEEKSIVVKQFVMERLIDERERIRLLINDCPQMKQVLDIS